MAFDYKTKGVIIVTVSPTTLRGVSWFIINIEIANAKEHQVNL